MNARSKNTWRALAEVALAVAIAALLVTTLLPAIITSLLH
jgi:hypothetical protein